MSTGRHRIRSRSSRARAVLTSPLGVTAIVVGLIVVLSLAIPAGLRYAGCAETRYLRVSTTLGMAPVLQKAADEFNEEGHSYSGECVFAQAGEVAPHRIMTQLAGGTTADSTTAPDVWVPESSAWVELARVSDTGARNIETTPRSLASSPVVLAAPEDAEGIPEPDEASWNLILPGERSPDRPMVMVDPNRGADGMTAMYQVREELGTGDEADTEVTDFVRDVQLDTAFDELDLASAYPSPIDVDPLTVVPEQAVLRYNSTGPETPIEALYPTEGTVSLDYPFVPIGDDPAMRAAADDLYEILQADSYREELRGLGFREPDGTLSDELADREDIIGEPPETHQGLTGDALLKSVEDWNRLSMPSRALVLADVSENMTEDLNGGPSRLDVTKNAAQLGLSLFPDETDLGLWLLSDEYEQGRDQVEDLSRLGGSVSDDGTTRRDELQQIAEDIEVEGGESRLYDNILAAFDEVQDAYDDDKINSVIVLTAGRDDGSSEISHDELVAELQDRFDPDQPVTMFIIAFGHQSEREELSELASATSGTLHVTDDPDEIGDIFLSSVSRRLCVPDCDE
ncbi:substrate-binding domain-containing protein [Allosalinactinospora lopnorensis]|uniref:substrate-binding domain-containing protein n=1 Tax=Allosalinactinospora lopnorensis TaxID=1352348 RepID=UPI000623D21B|nr:substrate-binding domain-containing protein [Allosalinactinospora lopnorensis]